MYVAKRLASMVGVVLAVTFLAFAALNFLGDPLTKLLGPVALAEPEDLTVEEAAIVAEARETYHLDEPFLVRYGLWLTDFARGDFGRSFKNQVNVSTIVADRLPITLLLMAYSQALALLVAVPWGVYAASRAYKLGDKVSTVLSFSLLGVPVFALVVLLFWLFAVRWDVFPTRFVDENIATRLQSLFLPALSLATPLIATYQRLLRTDLIATLQEDFIAVARAKGLPGRHVLFRHALRPSLFSLLTVFGINTAALIGGSLVVEQYFSVPGIGQAMIEAIIRDDFPLVLAVVVIVSTMFVAINTVVDVAYSYLDPRVRLDG